MRMCFAKRASSLMPRTKGVTSMPSLAGQIAVVTGASSGIGRAITLKLSSEGVSVYIIGRRPAALEAVGHEALKVGGNPVVCVADLERDKDITDLKVYFRKNLRHLDILVHSAGRISPGSLSRLGLRTFDRPFRVNVRAPYALTQAVLPLVKKCKGQVVFINSSAGVRSRAGLAAYAGSKHALKAIADALREEVNKDGLRIISIYPGRTATPMQRRIFRYLGTPYSPEYLMPPEDVAEVVADVLKLGRKAEVTDIHVRPAGKEVLI